MPLDPLLRLGPGAVAQIMADPEDPASAKRCVIMTDEGMDTSCLNGENLDTLVSHPIEEAGLRSHACSAGTLAQENPALQHPS